MLTYFGNRQTSLVVFWGQQYEALLILLRTNNLGRRVLKNTIATTISVVISVIPAVIEVFGLSTFLSPMTTVFAHPGQRLGMMVESQILILLGTTLGMCWGLIGVYLSNFLFEDSISAGYTLRAIFLVIAIILHGYLRSSSPRLFFFVLFHLIVATILLTKGPTKITPDLVTAIFYPILTANGIIILVSILVYPETAGGFIGKSTIDTLFDTGNAMRDAGDWFIDEALGRDINGRKGSTASINAVQVAKLANLTERKAKLRSTLAACKKAQAECNFELSYSVLPPRYLKSISTNAMRNLVQSTIALIGACESKYVLIGDNHGNHVDQVVPFLSAKPFEAIEEGDELAPTAEELPETEETPIIEALTTIPVSSKAPFKLLKAVKALPKSKVPKPGITGKLKLVKPQREVESGDAEILELILTPIRKPITDLKTEIDKAIDAVTAALAYCYDIRKLPSGWVPPDGVRPEEIDVRMELFATAIEAFDVNSAAALASAAALEDLESPDVDIMPRMETFLISSFLLSLRQAAIHTMHMLRHSRILVEKRWVRNNHRRLWFPRKINWRKWLASGGEEDNSALPENARKDARRGAERHNRAVDSDSDSSDDEGDNEPLIEKGGGIESGYASRVENVLSPVSLNNPLKRIATTAIPTKDFDQREKERYEKRREAKKENKIKRRAVGARVGSIAWLRGKTADVMEHLLDDEDLSYALKMAVALMLVTWPAFVESWRPWYSSVRGVWAPLQLIMVFEVSIGTSFWVFFVRLGGVITGCVWGFLAYQIGGGNPYVLSIVCMIGVIPGAYVQIGTKYVKAGMIGIISMCVVALVSYTRETPSQEIFLQRLVAFIIGGTFAMLVEISLYPVRARDRLVECLSSCITQMSNMQAAIAVGVDDPEKMDIHSPLIYNRFRDAKNKAQGALSAAETFLPFCLAEPRLKGSFGRLAPVYKEMMYVLHQIIDRMDNMLALRRAYGSSVLEELNQDIFAHRRNVAASVTLSLFAVNEAITTHMPLPQFLPSSRLAQLRLVNRVRHSLMEKSSSTQNVAPLVVSAVSGWKASTGQADRLELSHDMVKNVTQQKFLAWNAAAAGQIEIIEYLEELVDLAKLLVGVNAFRSGMLERPSYIEYVRRMKEKEMTIKKGEAVEKAKHRGEGAEGMAKVVSDLDLEAGRQSGTFSGGVSGIKRRSTFGGQVKSVQVSRAEEDSFVSSERESFRDRWRSGRLERRNTIRGEQGGSASNRHSQWKEGDGSTQGGVLRENLEGEENKSRGGQGWTTKVSRAPEPSFVVPGRRLSMTLADDDIPQGAPKEVEQPGRRGSIHSTETIPVSLQRVRTRMVDEMGVERRRRFTLLHKHQYHSSGGNESESSRGAFDDGRSMAESQSQSSLTAALKVSSMSIAPNSGRRVTTNDMTSTSSGVVFDRAEAPALPGGSLAESELALQSSGSRGDEKAGGKGPSDTLT